MGQGRANSETYGTAETPLIQTVGDPASDQLYTAGFALLALHEAFAACGDANLKHAEDKLADYLCRIQIRADNFPSLDGAWFRAFDYGKWDYWGSSADVGWGVCSVESGWGQAWIAATFGQVAPLSEPSSQKLMSRSCRSSARNTSKPRPALASAASARPPSRNMAMEVRPSRVAIR